MLKYTFLLSRILWKCKYSCDTGITASAPIKWSEVSVVFISYLSSIQDQDKRLLLIDNDSLKYSLSSPSHRALVVHYKYTIVVENVVNNRNIHFLNEGSQTSQTSKIVESKIRSYQRMCYQSYLPVNQTCELLLGDLKRKSGSGFSPGFFRLGVHKLRSKKKKPECTCNTPAWDDMFVVDSRTLL